MPSTVPFLVGFTSPENSTDNTGSDFVVGAWIPDSYQDGRAPMPREDDRIEVARFSRETYFVSNWTGAPATAGTVATKADELSKALDDNKVRFLFFEQKRREGEQELSRLFVLFSSFKLSPLSLSLSFALESLFKEHYHTKMAWLMSYR